NALAMYEMTGRIVGDTEGKRAARAGTGAGEQLTHIAHTRRAGRGTSGPHRIVLQEMAVLLHHGAASGCVHGDGRGTRALERDDVRAGERTGTMQVTGVCVQRAAAALSGCPHHV